MPSVPRHRASIYYEVHGKGPDVVLAHGPAGNTLSWYQQVPELSRRHRVILFDHRGWGRSFSDPAHVQGSYFVEDLRGVLDAEGVRRAALVGHSMGATTVLRTALDYPERVSCLVLVGNAGGLLTPRVVQALSASSVQMVRGFPWHELLVAADFRERDPTRFFLHAQLQALNPPVDPAWLSQVFEMQVRPEELTGYDTPTLLVTGKLGTVVTSEMIQEAAARIPGLKTYEFENAGGSPHFEAPEEFNRVVEDFIARHHRE